MLFIYSSNEQTATEIKKLQKHEKAWKDNFNKINARPVQWKWPNADEKNSKRPKWMGTYTLLMDQKKILFR